MQTGVITQENFSQILRGISQRRKQGTLEVHCGSEIMKVYFSAGRIVEVTKGGISPVTEFGEQLCAAGALPPGDWVSECATYEELLREGRKRNEDFSPELFAFALRHRVLDHLYQLNVQDGSYYSFHVEMINFERDHAPSISIGQLLLDLVAYYEDRVRFQEAHPPGTVFHRGAAPEGALSAEEDRIAWLVDGARTVEQIKLQSLVSSFHFQEAVSDLVRRGVIRTAPSAAAGGAAELFNDELFSSLDDSIDDAFKEMAAPAPKPAAVDQPGPAPQVTQPASPGAAAAANVAAQPTAVTAKIPAVPALERLNRWVLSRDWMPHFMVAGLVIASVVIPFFFWGKIFWTFSGR